MSAQPGTATIVSTVEAAVAEQRLAPGDPLPSVRALAADLAVSPATVASAYRRLRDRGVVVTDGRRGTTVAPVPPVRVRRSQPLAPGVRDLTSGNPDPDLLPALGPVLAHLDATHTMYGAPAVLPELHETAAQDFAADHVNGDVTVSAGALDAIERALQTTLRPGDRVVVEDPSWPRIGDLAHALGLVADPVTVDGSGLDPGGLERALRRGARAVVCTPRGQNPTAASIDGPRGRQLRAIHRRHPDVLVIEDDYVSRVCGAPYIPAHHPDGRHLVVRSMSKVLGPDLRIALAAGDPITVARMDTRQRLGPGWVSHLLQKVTVRLLHDRATHRLLARTEQTYTARRAALLDALVARGLPAFGRSGLGVWIPIHDEAAAARELLAQGWAVSPGERYRFSSGPGLRVTTAALPPDQAERLANAVAALSGPAPETYPG